MYYSDYRSHDTADGERNKEVSLYVSGCSLACKVASIHQHGH